MSKKNNNKHSKTAISASEIELAKAPDLSPEEAETDLVGEILTECIKIEEGRTRTVFPLCKLVAQYKEITSSKSVE